MTQGMSSYLLFLRIYPLKYPATGIPKSCLAKWYWFGKDFRLADSIVPIPNK